MALGRIATVSTQAAESLLLFRMRGREELGRPFKYDLELLGTDGGLSGSKLLGQSMTVMIEQQDGRTRHVNGIVTRFDRGGGRGRYALYEVTLRPALWLLSRSRDCRIFAHAAVPAVIKQVLSDHGLDDLRSQLLGEYPDVDYTVQYRESALDFVTRLMEREGIYYYFRHDEKKHTVVMTDAQHESAPNYAEVPYYPPDPTHEREEEHLNRWSVSEGIQPGVYALNAFDFEKPKANLAVRTAQPRDHANADFEQYDYSGDYDAVSSGESRSRIRLEALHAQHRQIRAEGNARGLLTGALFTLKNHPQFEQNKQYLVTSEEITFENNGFESGDTGEATLRTAITAIDAKTPFRLPAETPSPIISGPQTAIVVGPQDKEIWTDQYGRVKVQFHWDRLGESDGANSCWVRVAQVWAGARWGAMHIPRIGQEVIVEFLEGDPDQPIITGRVYNADNMPPYGLPENQTQSGIKSHSSKNGTQENFNELRFEDKKGDEEVFLHAEKNLNEKIKADHSTDVGGNQSTSVSGDQSDSVGGNQSLSVTGNQSADIEGSQGVTVGAGSTLGITGAYQVDATSTINVQSPVSINLQVGGSSILIEPSAITLSSGGKALLKLDVNALLASSQGTQLTFDANVLVQSVAGAQLFLDANVRNQSSAGAMMVLDANVLAQATGGGKVSLDANAVMSGAESTVAGDVTAQLNAGGNVKADPGGVTVLGSKVSIN